MMPAGSRPASARQHCNGRIYLAAHLLMPKYLTGLIMTDYRRFKPFPYKTRYFTFDLTDTPKSRRFSRHADEDETLPHDRRARVAALRGREVVIECRNE